MNYTEAVNLAKAGKEEGFRFLYESTCKNKYYLALKYMKDEQEAQDVLQDAYIKAFTKLDTLDKPEAFPGWLGTIVGNLAKNRLQKKNPLLFSDVAVNDEEEPFEYEIEDENQNNQPELSYSKQETQQLVHEMINALSEEQRVCILMYEIEGIPIKEIAAALDCSENTVKSRLNYARKNLKKKAEELQKKGYKLYGLSPLPLLLLLLRKEESYLSADQIFGAVQSQISQHVIPHAEIPTSSSVNGFSASQKILEGGKAAAAGVAKSGFVHTVTGKVTAALVALAVVGGSVVGGAAGVTYHNMQRQNNDTPSKVETEISAEISINSEPSTSEPAIEPTIEPTAEPTIEPTSEPEPVVKSLSDEDYPSLLAGNLTKEELEFVLAYGPEELSDGSLTEQDYAYILAALCTTPLPGIDNNGNYYPTSYGEASFVQHNDYGDGHGMHYLLKDVNRFFSSFTDFQYPEGSSPTGMYDTIDGETWIYAIPNINYVAMSEITSTEYTEEEIRIYYNYEKHTYDPPSNVSTTSLSKKATLQPIGDGKYRIVKIETVEP